MYVQTPFGDYTKALCFLPGPRFTVSGTPFVVYLHGATANERQMLQAPSPATGMTLMLDTWLDRGWGVLSMRLGTTGVDESAGVYDVDNNDGKWGNQPSRDATAHVWEWLNRWCAPHSRGLAIMGFSAGGIHGWNALLRAKQLGVPISCFVSVDGAANMRDMYTPLNPARAHYGLNRKTQLRNAYALPSGVVVGDANWIARVDVADGGHDPMRVPLESLPAVPVLLASSASDTGVEQQANAMMMRDRLLGGGWATTIGNPVGVEPVLRWITYSGGHGNSTHFLPNTYNPFIAGAFG